MQIKKNEVNWNRISFSALSSLILVNTFGIIFIDAYNFNGFIGSLIGMFGFTVVTYYRERNSQ